MPVTDPIADMLGFIHNAILRRRTAVEMPASKLKARIAEILKSEGFIHDWSLDPKPPQGTITLKLKWDSAQQCAIHGVRRVSRPGRRTYVGRASIPRVRSGLGIAILTTSRGLMTDRAARKAKLGGELMCEVW
jgi:small subunit ribosomal protein S8